MSVRLQIRPWHCALALACAVVFTPKPSNAQDGDQGMQVLTRGPVHEAFGEPIVYDPKPCPVIPRQPPPPIEEVPPDQKPEGNNVQWISGYWAWDDSRNDFLWVSGLWRDVPPGRRWVPGYWDQVQDGFQWVPGYWAPDNVQNVQYLPTPPQSIDTGPNSPPPSADATWVPGYWAWQGNTYAWRPGYWVPFQQDWLWTPPHYVWSPSGYLFVNGYWDRPLQQRGMLFAPVYYQQPLYRQQGYSYTPTVGLLTSALVSSMFVRPSYHQYYFGDYYGSNQFQSGYIPWYSYHQSRYGYDPLFAHYAAVNTRTDPNWINNLHQVYTYRNEHPDARPPRTYAQQQTFIQRNNITNTTLNNYSTSVTNIKNVSNVQNMVVGRPINQIVQNPNQPVRFERLTAERRTELGRQGNAVQQYGQERARREDAVGRFPANTSFRPKEAPMARSPIAAQPSPGVNALQAQERSRFVPPPAPVHPQPQPNVQPPQPGQFQGRFEPHPDRLPPPSFRPGVRPEDFRQPNRPESPRREATPLQPAPRRETAPPQPAPRRETAPPQPAPRRETAPPQPAPRGEVPPPRPALRQEARPPQTSPEPGKKK